jgi:hypothetical protein
VQGVHFAMAIELSTTFSARYVQHSTASTHLPTTLLTISFIILPQNNLVTIVRAHEVQELGYHKHFDPAYIEERMRYAKGPSSYRRRVSPRRSSADSVEMMGGHTEKPIASKKPFSVVAADVEGVPYDGDDDGGGGLETGKAGAGDNWYHPSDDIPTGTLILSPSGTMIHTM